MFESHSQNPQAVGGNSAGNGVPNNLPTEPEDMLAGVDKVPLEVPQAPNALKSGLLKPKGPATILPNPDYSSPVNSQPAPVETKKSAGSGMSKMIKPIIFVVGLLVVGGFGYGGFVMYQNYQAANEVKNTPVPQFETDEQNNNQQNVQVTTPTTTEQQPVANNPVVASVDTDEDGLMDNEELQLGTKIDSPDSDGDKISDMDETRVWMTDPLKADTDGDGYSDSSEIMNAYNPRGAGKFTPPLPIVRFVSSSDATSTYSYTNNVIKTQ